MPESVVFAVDVGRSRLRAVVCTPGGIVLERHTWPVTETRRELPAAVQRVRAHYGVPVVLTGRPEALWPAGLLETLVAGGVAVDLIGGRAVAGMLRLERGFREDPAYRSASLLAAIRRGRLDGGVEHPRSFVLNWCMEDALRQLEELMLLDAGDAVPGRERCERAGDWARCAVAPLRRSARP